MPHFDQVFTVCPSAALGVSSIQRVKNDVFLNAWVKVFRIIPKFRILRLSFQRKSASKI